MTYPPQPSPYDPYRQPRPFPAQMHYFSPQEGNWQACAHCGGGHA